MEFSIKKDSTLPILLMKVINDGKNGKEIMENIIENAYIEFSMINEESGLPVIQKKRTFITNSLDDENNYDGFYVYYLFTKKDTSKRGRFKGEFTINSDKGRIIVPIREELYINIKDAISTK